MYTHRFVFHPLTNICIVRAAYKGSDGTVNASGSALIQKAANQSLTLDKLSVDEREFVDHAIAAEWINDDGTLNGTFSVVPTDETSSHLKRLQIELTRQCNLSCKYCYSESGPKQTSNLTLQDVKKILDDASRLGCIWVDFTGGEPLLWPHWREAVSYARELGLVVSIHSNGTTLNRDNLNYLKEVNVRNIQITFESHYPTVHDRIRGLKGAFIKSLNGAYLAKNMKLDVKICLMGNKINKSHYCESALWFQASGFNISLDRVVDVGGEKEAKMGLTPAQYYEVVAPIVKHGINPSRICDNSISGNEVTNIEPLCGVAQSFVYLTADGEMALCPTMTSREETKFTGVSIREMSLFDAWTRSEYFNKYRYTNCKNARSGACPSARDCGGGCRSNAYIDGGEIDSPDVVACNIHKNETPEFINFYDLYYQGKFSMVSNNN